jgi:hypothetical protein
MKPLIILTGKSEWITEKLLPSLYTSGKYTGDVMIVSYGEFEDVDKLELSLKYEKHVFVVDAKKIYATYTADRFRAFTETLVKSINLFKDSLAREYDVIMHIDGSDIEFFQDINPLLEMAKTSICVIPEPRNNDNPICKKWVTIDSIPQEYWDAIGNKPVLNCGVFAGPSKHIYALCKLIAKFSEHDSRFGIDQLIFNVLFYYYKIPHKVVGREWDYHFYDKGWQNINGKPYFAEYAKIPSEIDPIWTPIAIMHYAGPQPFKTSGDRVAVVHKPIPKPKKKNWLFGYI